MILTSRAKLQSGSGPVTNSPATSGPPLNTTDGPSEARAQIAKAPSAKTGMRTRTPTTINTLRMMVLRSMFIAHSPFDLLFGGRIHSGVPAVSSGWPGQGTDDIEVDGKAATRMSNGAQLDQENRPLRIHSAHRTLNSV